MEKVMLYKIGRFQEDFEYVYRDVKVVNYVTDEKNITIYNNKKCIHIKNLDGNTRTMIVVCARRTNYIVNTLNKLGLKEDTNFMFLEDYVKTLDEEIPLKTAKEIDYLKRRHNVDLEYKGLSNSEMFIKMMNTEPSCSLSCNEPFRFAQIQPAGFVYPCCESWATEYIGNAYHESLKDIWNSTRARIYRVSIINKTYAFCNLDNCPLKDNGLDRTVRDNELKELKYPECLSLSFDPTCNLKCKMCRKCVINKNNNPIYQQVYKKISNRLFQDKWIPKVCTLLLSQNGEVFASNTYKKIIFNKKTRKTHSLVIHTNGLFLDNETLNKLCKVNKKYLGLFISVDSLNQETYKKLRDGSNLATLKKNLELISKARNKAKIEYVRVLCVLQRDNYKELPEIAKLAIDLKFDILDVTRITNWGTYTDEEFKEISMYDEEGNPKPELVEVLKHPIFKSKEIEFIGNVLKSNPKK